MSSSFPAMLENGGHDGIEEEGGRSAENVEPPATGSRRGGGSGLFGQSSDESGTLVVVATLITTLSYQIGSNVPGGYWQEDGPGHSAGESIMRTKRRLLYEVFMCSSWSGFGASMGLTLALLTGVPPRSRFVRGLFILSYSTLILSFITQQGTTFIWVGIIVWAAVTVLIASAVTYRTHRRLRRFIDWLCGEPVAQTS